MNYKTVKEYWDKHDEERQTILRACKETALETINHLEVKPPEKVIQDGIALGYYYAKVESQQN